jgi:hypothetical protein
MAAIHEMTVRQGRRDSEARRCPPYPSIDDGNDAARGCFRRIFLCVFFVLVQGFSGTRTIKAEEIFGQDRLARTVCTYQHDHSDRLNCQAGARNSFGRTECERDVLYVETWHGRKVRG